MTKIASFNAVSLPRLNMSKRGKGRQGCPDSGGDTGGHVCRLVLVCRWLGEDIRVFKYVIFKRFIRGWGFEGSGAWFVTTVCSQAVCKGVTVKVNVARDPPSSNLATVRRCLPDKRANSTN